MKYILIDTCSWINLISVEQENPHIERLDHWIKDGLIQIIMPEVIINEWDEHKEEEKSKIQQHWRTKQKHFYDIAKRTGNFALSDYNIELDFIEKQFKFIDDIIRNSSIHIQTSEAVKAIIPDKSIRPKKAPFHHKDESTKDAYLYFSTLEFCNKNGISELFFFSDNTSDFGKPLPNSTKKEPKGAKDTLHPDLLIDFPEVSVIYFGDIEWGIHELSKKLPPINSSVMSYSVEDEIYNIYNIDKNNPILEQIHAYVSKVHEEISFVPFHIFINQYPFKNHSKSYPHYSLFSLSTENQELFELFESIELSDNKHIKIIDEKFVKDVIDFDQKVKNVLVSLTKNLIFNVTNEKTGKSKSVKYSENKICNCPKCSFNKFKFLDCFKSLKEYPDSVKDLSEYAYVNYHIGNFVEASKNLKSLYKKAIESKLYTTAFIAKYNLSKLSIFIRNNYWGEQSQDILWKELESIDLTNDYKKYETSENKKLIAWIRDNKFYEDNRDKLQTNVSKILDYYYSQLNGGWSSNTEVWTLINNYSELEAFLNNNYIIYDRFKEFSDLSSLFIEGLFASHAMDQSQNSRLESFDDWLITQLLVYGNADNINKLFNRYKLKKISYKSTSNSGDSFYDLIDNFFDVDPQLRECYLKINEKDNRAFWDYYNSIFSNILTVVSICDFDKEYLNKFSEKLLTYLEFEDFIHFNNFKYVRIFLQRIGKELDSQILTRFFFLTINKSSYHKEDFYDAIVDILNARDEKITITKDQYESIYNLAFEKCSSCKENHSNIIIIPIYNLIENENFKQLISEKIDCILNNTFSFNLFYLATLFDIIEFNQSHFAKALEYSYPKRKQVSFKSAFSGIDDNRFDSFNHIINLCFKFGINTSGIEFTRFKELDEYYNWLLDMNGYNYDKFQPKWIYEYPTRYYYKTIGTNKKVKKVLTQHLKNNFESNLERNYLNIYIRKTWQTK